MSYIPEDWIPWLWPAALVVLGSAVAASARPKWDRWSRGIGAAAAIVAILCDPGGPFGFLRPFDPLLTTLHLLGVLGLALLAAIHLVRCRRDPLWGLMALVPFTNLLFAAALPWLAPPEYGPIEAEAQPRRMAAASIFAGSVLSAGASVVMVGLLAAGLGDYGMTLFVLSPLAISFALSSFFHRKAEREWEDTHWLVVGTLLLSALLLLVTGLEGLLCVAMVAPLWLVIVGAGILLGRLLRRIGGERRGPPRSLALLALPLALWGLGDPESGRDETFVVQTVVEVDAPSELVWPHVVAYGWIPEPENPLFRGFIARPLRAVIEGEGRGARRWCLFDTGAFEEVVEVWEPNAVLRFAVTSNPPPMRELNPFHEVDAPHLHGFYRSLAGEYRLEPLPGGRTRLIGTSWYAHGLRPAAYWRLWSDYLVREVHGMVLGHVKTLAEADALS